jgi:hypothetical protein
MSIGPARPIIASMALILFLAASTSWPDAAIAISGVALVGTIAVVVVWQALATWRTRIAVGREEAYRKLAEETSRRLDDIDERVLALARRTEDDASGST